MNFSVQLLPRAAADYRHIFNYIAERSPEGAQRWEIALEACLQRVGSNPLIYGLAPEDEHFDFELRQLLFKTQYGLTYRGLYRIEEAEKQVFVLGICGPGQAPLALDELPLV